MPISISSEKAEELMSRTCLVWTGLSRNANSVLKAQLNRGDLNTDNLLKLNKLTEDFVLVLDSKNLDFDKLGDLISEGWNVKKELEPSIVSPEILKLEKRISEIRPLGMKLLGAGGGGFFLTLLSETGKINDDSLKDIPKFNPRIDNHGVRILSLI